MSEDHLRGEATGSSAWQETECRMERGGEKQAGRVWPGHVGPAKDWPFNWKGWEDLDHRAESQPPPSQPRHFIQGK